MGARKPEMQHALLPAIVVGIDTPIGLAIIRDLGTRGVEVHGIARAVNAIGLSSRYLHKGYLREEGEEGLVQQLLELGDRLGDACLFAISESDIALLNRHRHRLKTYRVMFADDSRMSSVLNKERTYSAAGRVGIRVPRTLQINSFQEARETCESLIFPVVLKWANPNVVVKTLEATGLALHKTHYCYSSPELLAYLKPYEAVNIFPLIQEYCPGYGLGQFILMKEGRAHFVFQHERVHEWPPEGGFSTLCRSVSVEKHEALMSKSVALLRELRWEGVAMVEYRHDPQSGNSALMEINGRFWGSLPLACRAGASFPWLVYQLMGLNRPIVEAQFKDDVRCRFMIPETKRLLRILFYRKKIADRRLKFRPIPELIRYLFDFVRPRTCYFIFDAKDPGPFISDLMNSFRSISLRKKR
jgi:predicted ATP-grasp superfamily ATP-dependent carboligase